MADCPGCLHTVKIAADHENGERRLDCIIEDFRELRETIRECINGVQDGVKMLREGAYRFDRNEQDFQRHCSGDDGAHSRIKTELAAIQLAHKAELSTMQASHRVEMAAIKRNQKWQWIILGAILAVSLMNGNGPMIAKLIGCFV